jgi:hypothetical protein|tara:strand:- start:2192 stop:2392 length:201 start_codon:yes stop_codon:yes gene_type:complete
MDEPDNLIVNPIQIELLLIDDIVEKITEIEKRFNDKMERLRNISIQNKRVKNIIKNMSRGVILVDV